jgi:Ca2+-binding RTX toxin-like protein
MFSKRMWGLAAPLAAAAVTLVSASPASAANQGFGCRASVARVSLLNGAVPAVEPFVANPNDAPCQTAAGGVSTGGLIDLSGLNLGGVLGSLTGSLGGNITVGPVTANTNSVATDSQMSASALASVSGVTIPTPAGAISIVGPAQATASYECVNGAPQGVAGSTLSLLTVAGRTIALPPNGGPLTIPLTLTVPSLLPGVLPPTTQTIGSIAVNNQIATGSSITEQLLNVSINNVASIVVGEAKVDQPAVDPCNGLNPPGPPAPTNGTNGTNGNNGTNGSNGSNGNGANGSDGANGANGTTTSSSVCPVGATLLASSGLCAIVNTSGTGTNAIAVGSPNSGDIIGGKVISLAAARAKYKSICLKGPGPKYVVIGTEKADHMTVKNKRMRVLALGGNDTVTVKGGKGTCVDGGAGNDRISNLGTNTVSVYGANGNDAVTIGNGKAYVSGGNGADSLKAGNGKVSLLGNNGNDKITAGNGNDQLNGDAGNDVITAGTGVDRINGGSGTNRLTAHGKKAYLKATGGHSVGYLTKSSTTKKYARTHGVKVKMLG